MGAPYNLDDRQAIADYQNLENAPYRDLDASLTKTWLLAHRDQSDARQAIDLTLGKRPAEELYDLQNDPAQLHNLAGDAGFQEARMQLSARLMAVLRESNDPRLSDAFDKPPFVEIGTTKTSR